jgi:hypothetical protein
MIATEICTVEPTDRAVSGTSYVLLTTYMHDFQNVILVFFQTNTINMPAVLYGGKMYLSSEVKSIGLV